MTPSETALAFALLGGTLATTGLLAVQRYLRARFARFEDLSADAAEQRAYLTHLLERVGAEQAARVVGIRSAIAAGERAAVWRQDDLDRIARETEQRAKARRLRAARIRRPLS